MKITMCCFALLAMVSTVRAQPTNAVRFELNARCGDPAFAELILNGHELHPANIAKLKDVVPITWAGTWHNKQKPREQFPADGSCAGLHFRGRRTVCTKSKADMRDDRVEAVFGFDCGEEPAYDVKIEMDPNKTFHYRRLLEKSGKGYCNCDDSGDSDEPVTAHAVQFPDEKMKLELDLHSPDHALLWFRLNDQPFFQRARPGTLVLDHTGIAAAITRSSRLDAFSSNSYDGARASPKVPQKSVTLTVK